MTDEQLKHHFQQPCCVTSKLPHDIIEAHGCFNFYTHCDVPMEKFYRAIGSKVEDPHVMVLNMMSITELTARFLEQCFDRKWITDLVLSTAKDNTALVQRHLASYQQNVLYAVDEGSVPNTQHLVLYSDYQALSISGPMYNLAGREKLAAYSMLYHEHFGNVTNKECGNPLRNILLPDAIRHRRIMRHDDRKISPRLINFLEINFPPYRE